MKVINRWRPDEILFNLLSKTFDMGILEHLEIEWAQSRDQWSADRWKSAANIAAQGFDKLEYEIKGFFETYNDNKGMVEQLFNIITQLQARRVGRPRKERRTKYRLALSPTTILGRPIKYSTEHQKELLGIVLQTRVEHGFKTDKKAISWLLKDVPARNRRESIDRICKLTSRARKNLHAHQADTRDD